MAGDDTVNDELDRSVNPSGPSLLELTAARPAARRLPGDVAHFEQRYTMIRELGRGAMGEVWLCFDRTVGREVAMKLLRPHLEASSSRWRFVREARVQGQLEHPSVVPLYDMGLTPDGRLYFTMKRIVGQSLAEILNELKRGSDEARRTYSRRRLLGSLSRAALAVDYIHRRGVVHRDLKPQNIMLGGFGEVYVLDWGLAKLVDVVSNDSRPSLLDASGATRTGEGAVLGTPSYMSPEQLRGQNRVVGPRSDVYSLGTILFEVLTLTPLHPPGSIQGKLLSVLQTDGAVPSERVPEAHLDSDLDAICRSCTRLDPKDRFASAGAVSAALESYLDL